MNQMLNTMSYAYPGSIASRCFIEVRTLFDCGSNWGLKAKHYEQNTYSRFSEYKPLL